MHLLEMLFAKHNTKTILKDKMVTVNYGKITLNYK